MAEKHYPTTIGGLLSAAWDKVIGNTETQDSPNKLIDLGGEPQEETKVNYFSPILGAPQRWKESINNGTNPLTGINRTVVPAATTALAGKLVTKVPQVVNTAINTYKAHPILSRKIIGNGLMNFGASLGLGMAGAKAIDKVSEATTGNNWAQNISDYTGLPKVVTEFTNPGWLAGGAGKSLVNTLKRFTPLMNRKNYFKFIREQYKLANTKTKNNLENVINHYLDNYNTVNGTSEKLLIDPINDPARFSLKFTNNNKYKLSQGNSGEHSFAMFPASNIVGINKNNIPLIGKYFLRNTNDIQHTIAHEWTHGAQDAIGNHFKYLGWYNEKLPIKSGHITDNLKFDSRSWASSPEELGAEFFSQLASNYNGKTFYELSPKQQVDFTNFLGDRFTSGLKNNYRAPIFHPSEFKAAKENAKLLPQRFETWSNETLKPENNINNSMEFLFDDI